MYTTQMPTAEKIKEAREIYGRTLVETVLAVVSMCDPDAAYSTFLDMGQEEEAEAVEFLFFE